MPKSALATAKTTAITNGYADAGEVARKLLPPEPVFCFSRKQLSERLQLFQKGFPGEVSFAVKSNPSPDVLQALSDYGLDHWDVASVHEMEAVARLGRKAVFHYHNPVKSRAEIRDAYLKFGCRRFAVDCREELRKIAEIVTSPKGVEIAVRFVLPRERTSSAHDFSSKFGAPDYICVELLKEAKERGFTPLLTFHPGSQSRDPLVYKRHIEAAARIARTAGVELTKLNVGGGFPANYQRSTGGPLGPFFAMIQASATLAFGKGKEPKLECEPGRGLVATSMSLLVRVKLVCTDGDDIFINDGVYGGLMEVMQVPELEPPYRVLRDGEVLHGETKSYKVFGPTCDPLDVLPHRMELPAAIQDEDYIEFGNLGAYGIATSTLFNGYGGHKVVDVDEALAI
jgi:ornithine decarboxylase